MGFKIRIFTTFLIVFHWSGISQKSLANTSNYASFQKAYSIFKFGQYNDAQKIFSHLTKTISEGQMLSNSIFYDAVCALRLNQPQSQRKIEEYIEQYSVHPKNNWVFLETGHYYFDNNRMAYAKKWYQMVNPAALNKSSQDQFHFNYAYSNYKTDNLNQAEINFKKVQNSDLYGSQSKYYLGYIAYNSDDYDTASSLFQNDGVEQYYGDNLEYFKADLKFKLGAFQDAIQAARGALQSASTNQKSELSKIIGESYFNLKQYQDAIPFLQQYLGKNGQWAHVDFYQLGYAYYKIGSLGQAINEFNKIILGSDSISQNAYYHLADCYLKNNQKQQALHAFKKASEMSFNPIIQEDAFLNYAKLSYEIGNPYETVTELLTKFLKSYPKSPFKNSIEALLIDSYFTSNNYKEALEIMGADVRSDLKPTFQKVAFYRALELYNLKQYSEAQSLLNKVINIGFDSEIVNAALYWNAEINYELTNFNEALAGYLSLRNNSPSPYLEAPNLLEYNIGYAYFKLKRYSEAIMAFQNYCNLTSKDDLFLNDALMRTADAYYVTKQYQKAIDLYGKVVQNQDALSDYAMFQMAVSYGFLGDISAKIRGLKNLLNYHNSNYIDEVYFELANTYNIQNQSDKAIQYYDLLINDYPSSILLSKAQLRKGLLLYNNSQNDMALSILKEVAEHFPSTPEAYQAINTVRSIYVENGQVEAYASWVGQLEYLNSTNMKLEQTAFDAAEQQFLNNNTNKAIKLFNAYIVSYPKGSQLIKAHFYLAELYAKEQLQNNAIPHYKYVIGQPANEYTETALQKLCIITIENNEEEAIPYLIRLVEESKNIQNRIYAQFNLMKQYFDLENYEQAMSYADLVLDNDRNSRNILNEALAVKARSALALNNEVLAESVYLNLSQNSSGILGAEAMYYLAVFSHKKEKFEHSNTLIQDLIKSYPNQKRYAAEGLVLMAQNFYALEDTFQATYILNNIVTNFSQYEDLVLSAKALLSAYQNTASKTNSSVQTSTLNDQ